MDWRNIWALTSVICWVLLKLPILSSSLNSLIKNLGKDDLKCFSQESDSKVLGLVKEKIFYPHEYMSDFETF